MNKLRLPLMHSFSTREKVLFFKRLSLYLRTGTPLLTALMLITESATPPHLHELFTSLSEHVRTGHSLSHAMEQHARFFPPFVSALVHTGEESGRLSHMLEQIARMLEKNQELNRKVQSALIYPSIVVIATLAIAAFLTTYAFPKIIPLFRGFRAALPLPTRMLIWVSDVSVHYGLLILGVLALLTTGAYCLRKQIYVRRAYEYVSIHTPIIGSLVHTHQLILISRTLSILLMGGTPLPEALALTERTSDREDVRRALTHAHAHVESGGTLSEGLSSSTLFPRTWIHLIATGEATGTLIENLTTLCELAEQDLDEQSRLLATLIEPILMLIMGLLVGFIALAIITPLYQITQDIQVH